MNQASPPIDDERGATPDVASERNNARSHKEDPTYYYPDGSAVFLVESILFKLQASLILPISSVLPLAENSGPRYPTGVENLPHDLTQSNDTNPIILSNVTASQFRNYLFALLGRPHDPACWAFFTDARSRENHNQGILVRYLDVASLARQFGMSTLEAWAVLQLELVLESIYELANDNWNKDTLLRLNTYARAVGKPKLRSLSLNFIQYFVSISVVPDSQFLDRTIGHAESASNLDTCVQLYQDPDLPINDPALFGCIFSVILSLGHRSTTWTSKLTLREKRIMYAAQVQLTSLPSELKSLGWLKSSIPPLITGCCPSCRSRLEVTWKHHFRGREGLGSPTPLKDVTTLAQIPQSRRYFIRLSGQLIDDLRGTSQKAPTPTPRSSTRYYPFMWLSSMNADGQATSSEGHNEECQNLDELLDNLDLYVQPIYEELTRYYQDFASGS